MTEYKNKVLFLRKSEKGEHLYAFDRDGILGGDTESLVLNVSEVKDLISGHADWVKVSAMSNRDGEKAEIRQEELGDQL